MITLRKQHQRYPKYRDSGVEWLGEVPETWSVLRADSVLEYEKFPISPEELSKKESVFHYSIPSIEEIGDGVEEEGNTISSNKWRLRGGELLISKLNPRKGHVLIAKKRDIFTVCSTEFIPLLPKRIHLKYAYYLYCSYWLKEVISARVQSATKSHQRANPNDIAKVWFALPSVDEQSSIASYLDEKCMLIDSIIAKKQRQIELLKEKRAAIINRAVTRGLDEDVEMKESGNFGEVPKVWSEQRLKNVVQLIKTGTTPSTKDISFFDGIKTWFTPSDFEHFLLKDSSRTISESAIQNGECRLFPAGSVLLICIGATLGKVGYSEEEFCCNQQINVIVPSNSMNHRFIAYFLLAIQELIKSFSLVTTMAILNQDRLRQIPIIVPSCAEQDRIADYIDQKTARIDSVIEINEHSISLLSEYKTSLISHAVTGRIKVA